MGFKIDDTQLSVYGQNPPSMSGRISPQNDSFSHNDVNFVKKEADHKKTYEIAKVATKSSNPILELLRRVLSTIRYG